MGDCQQYDIPKSSPFHIYHNVQNRGFYLLLSAFFSDFLRQGEVWVKGDGTCGKIVIQTSESQKVFAFQNK
jgi:hypothetical protein